MRRHNSIRDLTSKCLKQADYSIKIEQKCKSFDEDAKITEELDNEIPGDVMVKSWHDLDRNPACMD